MVVLRLENIDKSFGGIRLFDKANLELTSGTISALFGGNGTGKTTLFNIICQYDKQDSGQIWFNDALLQEKQPYRAAVAGIGKMWQTPQIFRNHSLLDNMLAANKLNKGDSLLKTVFSFQGVKNEEIVLKEKAKRILANLSLNQKKDILAGNLSFGETKLLSLAMLIMNDSKLLMLDEAFSNVNSKTIDLMILQLEQLKLEGKTIFMIEHKVNEAKKISDHLYKVENKKIIAEHG